ncbi:hypothetical protein XELAEV_18015048mg [Xenopus laevis]|uniref:Uncharacterized protein n=1 Tax=Xenopus laevis TaxID=8355 RepID=A0A974DJ41_XENLA|nr:hypothetical protein XELAEV_18015048mg [Xenopus laevis]
MAPVNSTGQYLHCPGFELNTCQEETVSSFWNKNQDDNSPWTSNPWILPSIAVAGVWRVGIRAQGPASKPSCFYLSPNGPWAILLQRSANGPEVKHFTMSCIFKD